MMGSIYWDIPPCTPLKNKIRFGGTFRLRFQGRRINQEEASETSTDFQRTTRCYFLEEAPFKNTYTSWKEQIITHGPRRDSEPRLTLLARASSNSADRPTARLATHLHLFPGF